MVRGAGGGAIEPVVNVLGPLMVRAGAREVSVPGRREGIVLAALAMDFPRPVGVDALVDLLWGDEPPRTAEKTLQTYMSRLRRLDAGLTIERVERSYVLRFEDGDVDVTRFRQLVADADGLDAPARRDRLADALSLWRADEPADLGDTIAAATRRSGLVEERVAAVEARIDADLELGRAAEVVAKLETLVSSHPYRERLWAALMLALYRTRRQADALAAYQRARERLGDDRGLDPSPHLKDLERRIVAHDPTLEAPGRRGEGASAGRAGGPVDESPRVLTFLFTDIEDSTPLWERETDGMADAIVGHHRIVTEAVTASEGRVFSTGGDSFAAVFDRPDDAVEAAVATQTALEGATWSTSEPLRVRIGLHAGVAIERDHDFFGPVVNEAARVMSAGHGGQVLMTEAVRQLCPSAATKLLGVFELRGVKRAVEIHQLVVDGLAREFPPLRAVPSSTRRWVVSDAPLIGRDRDVDDVVGALGDARVVTLVGPGGVGKTSVAHRVASELRSDRHVVLAGLVGDDEAGVAFTVAATAGFSVPTGADPIAHLVTSFGASRMLLVLDNCEHVLAAVRELAEAVVSGCADVRILATSREVLGVGSERVIDIPPLIADDETSPAVALLIARATEADPTFSATGQLDALTKICRQLDGLPLAIELAAARLRTISAVDLADRLEQRRWLVDSERTQDGRSRSLRATIAWSHDLLDESERTVFRRLAPLVATFDLDTAEQLAADGDLHPVDVTQAILSLVDRSLLVADGGRFHFLDTIRSYAEDQLRHAGEEEAWRDRHAELVIEQLSRLETVRRGREEHQAVLDFGNLTDDLRAALRWTSRSGNAEGVDRLVDGSIWFVYWSLRADLFDLYREVVDHLDEASIVVGPHLLGAVALGAVHRGDLNAAGSLARRSWEAGMEAGHGGSELGAYAMVHRALRQGDFAAVSEWSERLIELGTDTYALRAWQVMQAAALGYAGKPQRGLARLDELTRERPASHITGTDAALVHFTRGELLSQLDPDAAIAPLQAAIDAAGPLQNRLLLGAASVTLASLAARSDDTVGALSAFADLIEYWSDHRAAPHRWTVLRNLVELLARAGHGDDALVLHHAAESSASAPAMFGDQQERFGRLIAGVERSVGVEPAAQASRRGRALADTEVFDYASAAIARILET